MRTGGLCDPNQTHVTDVLKAALEILSFMDELKAKHTENNKVCLSLRIS